MNRLLLIISIIAVLTINYADSQVLEIHKNIGNNETYNIEEIDSITFNEPYVYGDSVLLNEDFESHPLYSFPFYSGWTLLNMAPNPASLNEAIVMLDNKYHTSGQKSLKVFTHEQSRILINNKLKRTPNVVYFEAKIFLERFAVDSGKTSVTEFGFRNIGESLSGENYAGLVIKEDGIIYCKIGPKESAISNMDLNRWYRIRLSFDVINKSLSVWFNLQPVVPKFSGILPTFGYTDFSIISNNSNIYFDDIKIWESK